MLHVCHPPRPDKIFIRHVTFTFCCPLHSQSTPAPAQTQPRMYRSVYGDSSSTPAPVDTPHNLQRTVSLDAGLNLADGLSSSAQTVQDQDPASEYLDEVFGGDLSHVLSECAKARPKDPISFLALLLERWRYLDRYLHRMCGIFQNDEISTRCW